MNSVDAFNSTNAFKHNKIFLGTSVVFYGDELGMSGVLDELDPLLDEIKDPFAKANCAMGDVDCYISKSRDTMRTPMQVCFVNQYWIYK